MSSPQTSTSHLSNFTKNNWPAQAYPTAFLTFLAKLQEAQLDATIENLEKLKISETLDKVDGILLGLKTCSQKEKHQQVMKMEKSAISATVSSSKSGSKIKINKSNTDREIQLPKFHLCPPKILNHETLTLHDDISYDPLLIIKSSLPEKQAKLIKNIKNIEKNIYETTFTMHKHDQKFKNFVLELDKIVESKVVETSEISETKASDKISKNLTFFVAEKLKNLENEIMMDNSFDKSKVLNEFRDLSVLVSMVEGKSTKIMPVVYRDQSDFSS